MKHIDQAPTNWRSGYVLARIRLVPGFAPQGTQEGSLVRVRRGIVHPKSRKVLAAIVKFPGQRGSKNVRMSTFREHFAIV